MLKKFLKYLKREWKVCFCYGVLLLGILFTIALFVIKPQQVETHYTYQYSNKIVKQEITFPIIQNIIFEHDNLKLLNVFLQNSSFDDKLYSVKLLDEDGNEYFNSELSDNGNGIISISLDNLNLLKNYNYILEIDYDLDESTEVSVKDSDNEKIYLEGMNDKTLEMTVNYAIKNNTYFWYSALIIVFALTLLPVAKGENNENF